MNNERKHYRETLTALPDELKALPTWVCYRLEERFGQDKLTKVPYNPTTGAKAKANDHTTWSDYDTCVDAVEHGDYDGIGFEFANGYVGVDLDHCRNADTGEVEDWASDTIAHLNSYTEASPSGTGVHIIAKGTLPCGGRRIGRIEMYEAARFFTMTGEQITGTATSIEERSAELKELHEALFQNDQPAINVTEASSTPERQHVGLSDAEIVEKASNAANGVKFRRLWAGDWQGQYGSQSEADQALCCDLAFWTGKNGSRIDTLFRQSALYRKKWDRQDYRDDTIAKAIGKTQTTYNMSQREKTERLYGGLTSVRGQCSDGNDSALPQMNLAAAAAAGQRGPTDASKPTSVDCPEFRYSRTDLGNSERFIRQHGDDLRYCVETSTWHIWNGTRWEPDALMRVRQRAKATVRKMYDELALESDPKQRGELFAFIQKSESERSLNALVSLAKTDPRIAVSVAAFDTQPHLLNCLNGTIDLRSGELLPHRREDLITKQCPVAFDQNAKSKTWERFLQDCTRGDSELQGFLQRAVGYTLYGDPREQVILMVHGPGATGKSTFIAAVMAILGSYATTADFSTFLKRDRVSGGPSDDVANLAGARLVSSVEVDDGKQLAQALLKQLTGGDTIRARHLYQHSFEFRPQFAMWLVCNHAPVVAHDDDALWRRLLRLPFENVIPPEKRDKTLRSVLTDITATGPAVLAWAVQGCTDWYHNGLRVPASVQLATDAYKQKSNPLSDFVSDACILEPTAFTTVADMRRDYESWVRETGERVLLNRTEFVAALRDLGCTPTVRRSGRGWNGIALRSDANSLYATLRKGRATAINPLLPSQNEFELAV